MEAVVDGRLVGSAALVVVDQAEQALALLLEAEVDDGRGPTARGRDGASQIVI